MKQTFPAMIFFFCLSVSCQAQKIEYPPHFRHLLKRIEAEMPEPADAGYRDYIPAENPYHNCHFSIRSAREGLDIRFYIIPWEEGNPHTTNPHVATFATVTDVASNADDAIISAIRPTREAIREDFNADWGMTYFFTPKEAFSDRKNCRMVALCKEGKGTVFIFYLFDDPGNEALDIRYRTLRFM